MKPEQKKNALDRDGPDNRQQKYGANIMPLLNFIPNWDSPSSLDLKSTSLHILEAPFETSVNRFD